MTMRQILSVVFSAFWDRADLYTDVLGLEHDQATPRQLKLAFLRQGRVVLATPIESPDDMTLLSAGIRGMITSSSNSDAISTVSVVQSGTPVSRKAKLRFQAVSLAYELLKDGDKRKAYNEWKLWNSRLPSPLQPPPSSSDDHDVDDDDADNHGGLRNSSSTMNQHRNVTRFSPGRRRESSDASASVTSILKKPNAPKRFYRNKRKNQLKSTRSITWNEEVEELTIAEQQTPYDPLVDGAKENAFPTNYHGVPDPYGDSAEDWCGTVDSEMPRYDRRKRSAHSTGWQDRNMPKEKNIPSILYAQEANMGFGESTSRSSRYNVDHDFHNFQALNSNNAMIENSKQGVVFEGYDPNDSLMVILDGSGDEGEPQLQFQHQPQTRVEASKFQKKQKESEHESWNGFSKDVKDFANRYNQPDVNDFENRFNQPDTSEKAMYQAATPLVKNSSAISSILPRNPEPGDDDGDSLTSNGNSLDTGSWGSLPTIDHQDECDFGRTIDLARGFQASLSNYINAAVEDMKEGLQVIGKQWDELEIVPSGTEAKNFFFLDTSELDAMMGILRTEMDTFSNYANPKVAQEQAPVPADPESAGAIVKASPTKKQFFSTLKQKSKRRFRKLFSRS
jgi:curved DNA-binding protein CbpA